MTKPLSNILAFLHHEATAGVLVMVAAAAALLIDNSPASFLLQSLLDTPLSVRVGMFALDKPLLLWINDGLMAVFFLLVGLEIKRELIAGELSTREQAVLPVIAAIGGMVVPALFYLVINATTPANLRGWAIPTATDIAFALGVVALLGSRVPPPLKIFVLALAIIDDLGAIIIIALFYTADLSVYSLAMAALGAAALFALNRLGVRRIAPYILVGVVMWVFVLKSGVHATLAGVVVALAIPMHAGGDDEQSPLHKLEEMLHPWVAFGILPIFALANAGVSLTGLSLAKLASPVPLGIMLGLFVGKQAGVFGSVWLAARYGIVRRPEGASWLQVYGVSILTGIGFTMSLFIGTLAFPDPAYAADIRIGVLAGSLLSAVVGYLVLMVASGHGPAAETDAASQTGRA